MSKLFILGSGFSKAVSERMPTIGELGTYIRDKIQELPTDQEVYERLISAPMNIEGLLTYLYQEMPWKTPEQTLSDKAAFVTISKLIVECIEEREKEVYEEREEIPTWAEDFVVYLHKEEAIIATFNYDTILEGLSAIYLRACLNGDFAQITKPL